MNHAIIIGETDSHFSTDERDHLDLPRYPIRDILDHVTFSGKGVLVKQTCSFSLFILVLYDKAMFDHL